MTRASDAEQFRQQMEVVRSRLADDVQRFSQSARQLVDWRRYWRRYPWIITGSLAAAAYFLMPRRPRRIVLPTRAIQRYAKQDRLLVQKAKPAPQGGTGLTALIVSAVVATAVRQAISQLGRQGAQIFAPARQRDAPVR